MSLSSLQLDAFVVLANYLSFTKAANILCITQSALSQRIAKLEKNLGILFIRGKNNIVLTNRGQQLLIYCRQKNALEEEFLQECNKNSNNCISGSLRIAAPSTTLRTFILPKISQLLLKYPNINIEIFEFEIRDLMKALHTNTVDFIFSPNKINLSTIDTYHVGFETNILAESKKCNAVATYTYIDHDAEDETTEMFLNEQREKLTVKHKHYLDNIHLIVEGVRLGMGRAVLPIELVHQYSNLQQVKNTKIFKTPIYLMYYKQTYHTKLQLAWLSLFNLDNSI